MSHSFKCGQFDDAFCPKRLQNWQTPRWNPEKPHRDPFNVKKTEFVVNEKGHLLPGVNRVDRNPWNNYVGTSDMPAVITKAIATDIATRPAHCIEYLDKPSPLKPPVNEPTWGLKYRPGCSKVAEGPDHPDHSRFVLTGDDYADHEKRIKEAGDLANKFIKCQKLIPQQEAERACKIRQLERELWRTRECQRRAELHQDVDWLKNHRFFSNIVARQTNWSAKNLPPRTGMGADGPLFGLGDEETVMTPSGGTDNFIQKYTSHYEKKRKPSAIISEEEATRIYTQCVPDLTPSNRLRILRDGEEICVPYDDATNPTQGEGSGFRGQIQEGGVVGGGRSVEFYCPVPREGAPRPVITGELINPNVKDGGYISKKFRNKKLRAEPVPEHDCSEGCRIPVKGALNGCSNGEGSKPSSPHRAQNCDNCDNGGCSPRSERRQTSPLPLRSSGNCLGPVNSNGQEFNPEYPQFEDTDEVLRKPRPGSPEVEPGFPEQAVNNPNVHSYPRQDLLLRPDYPDLYTIRSCEPNTSPKRGSPKPLCQLPGDELQQNRILEVCREQENVSPLSSAPVHPQSPQPKPPPPSANVGAQFSLIGDPSQIAQPSAPPHRAPPAAPTALAAAPAASVAAKELKNANLEHQPLADAVREPGFCRLAARGHPNPGIALDCEPAASGIGWRPFDAPGPTNCSKQRVYRPHTAGCGMQNTLAGAAFAKASRPVTAAPRRRHVSQMELAIGWETIPDYPEDEPRPPKHVDGSNGSAAPGIFCRVPAPERTPTLPTPPRIQTPMNHEPNSDEIRTRLAMLQRDRAASAAMDACRRAVAGERRRRRSSAGGDPRNLEDHIAAGFKVSIAATNAARRRLPRRAAEQTVEAPRMNRSCEACSAPNGAEPTNAHRLPPAPFKAGKAPVCLSTNSSFDGGGSSGSGRGAAAAKAINVPRPRLPFSRRGYEITTLAQPFAMDKNGSAGGAYPEHWRLASVYQLSYKPLVSRNKPLIKTVFQ